MVEIAEKIAALELLVKKYRQFVVNAEKERAGAQFEANSHVGAMELRYDTFKEEAQYLAQAHLKRVYELESGVQKIEELIKTLRTQRIAENKHVGLGSIVCIETEDRIEIVLFWFRHLEVVRIWILVVARAKWLHLRLPLVEL